MLLFDRAPRNIDSGWEEYDPALRTAIQTCVLDLRRETKPRALRLFNEYWHWCKHNWRVFVVIEKDNSKGLCRILADTATILLPAFCFPGWVSDKIQARWRDQSAPAGSHSASYLSKSRDRITLEHVSDSVAGDLAQHLQWLAHMCLVAYCQAMPLARRDALGESYRRYSRIWNMATVNGYQEVHLTVREANKIAEQVKHAFTIVADDDEFTYRLTRFRRRNGAIEARLAFGGWSEIGFSPVFCEGYKGNTSEREKCQVYFRNG